MNNKFKLSIPIAILITLMAVIYQRSTGPTYPKKVYFPTQNNSEVRVKFLRSHVVTSDAQLALPKLHPDLRAEVSYRRYPTKDQWTTTAFKLEGNQYTAYLPKQPPAGKISYFIKVYYGDKLIKKVASIKEPILIRFKGEVPIYILAPHIFCMFMALLFGALAGVEALFKTKVFYKLSLATVSFLAVGGLMLGPIVQKYAFGVYWAGIPFDWDLTDNKLLVSFLAWAFASIVSFKKKRAWATILAALILMGVYCIPHSMQGSQYNYEKKSMEYK